MYEAKYNRQDIVKIRISTFLHVRLANSSSYSCRTGDCKVSVLSKDLTDAESVPDLALIELVP